jgi:hypothetical protein
VASKLRDQDFCRAISAYVERDAAGCALSNRVAGYTIRAIGNKQGVPSNGVGAHCN